MKKIWSYGGGKQSAAIAALILQDRLPKPDLIVMADTGRERSSTWRYLDGVIGPSLDQVGLERLIDCLLIADRRFDIRKIS